MSERRKDAIPIGWLSWGIRQLELHGAAATSKAIGFLHRNGVLPWEAEEASAALAERPEPWFAHPDRYGNRIFTWLHKNSGLSFHKIR